MSITSTITQKGQVTIPVEMRRKLDLKPFDRLIFRVEKEKLIAEPAKQTFLDLAGSLHYKHKGKKPLDFKKLRRRMEKEISLRIIEEMKRP